MNAGALVTYGKLVDIHPLTSHLGRGYIVIESTCDRDDKYYATVKLLLQPLNSRASPEQVLSRLFLQRIKFQFISSTPTIVYSDCQLLLSMQVSDWQLFLQIGKCQLLRLSEEQFSDRKKQKLHKLFVQSNCSFRICTMIYHLGSTILRALTSPKERARHSGGDERGAVAAKL